MLLPALLFLALIATQKPAPPETVVEGVTATPRKLFVPITSGEYDAMTKSKWRAPLFSLEQMASFICEAKERKSYGRNTAEQAYRSTQEFERIKADYRTGLRPIQDLVAADINRQGDVLTLIGNNSRSTDGLPAKSGAIEIKSVSYEIAYEAGEQVAKTKIVMLNSGRSAARIPTFSIVSVDRFNIALADETFSADEILPPGQAVIIEKTYTNLPYYAYDMKAYFGQGRWQRNTRGCTDATPFHPPGGLSLPVASLDKDEAMLAQIRSGLQTAGGRITFENVTAVKQGGGGYVVSAIARNKVDQRQSLPAAIVLLLNADGQAIGAQRTAFDQMLIPSKGSTPITLPLDNVLALPAAKGGDPMTLVKRLMLVVGG